MPECGLSGTVQVVLRGGKLLESFPPEVIDFDSINLPEKILSPLEEAVKAQAAGCFRASALMVRRVLEELCNDKGAAGGDLKQRLAALSGRWSSRKNCWMPPMSCDCSAMMRRM
jgi:uncharacterized protein DUF4145